MRDFFKSDGYKRYRARLKKVIDNKTAELIVAEAVRVPQLQAEVRALAWVMTQLPDHMIRESEQSEEPETMSAEDVYGAELQENVEKRRKGEPEAEGPGEEYGPGED